METGESPGKMVKILKTGKNGTQVFDFELQERTFLVWYITKKQYLFRGEITWPHGFIQNVKGQILV